MQAMRRRCIPSRRARVDCRPLGSSTCGGGGGGGGTLKSDAARGEGREEADG
jgi:hypothetical protein